MRISDDLIEQVAGDPARGVVALQAKIEQVLDSSYDWTFDDYELLIEALALIGSLKEAGTINYSIAEPKVTGNLQTDCLAIRDFFRAVISRLQVASNRDKYEALKIQFKSRFGGGHLYEFSQGDLDRVQQLINELRENIAASSFIDDDHKRRLLARLEKLQAELHKKISTLDHFWGLVGDAGITLGKFGKDAKPLVDRIREIVQIVWATQARSEELLSSTPLPILTDSSQGDAGAQKKDS